MSGIPTNNSTTGRSQPQQHNQPQQQQSSWMNGTFSVSISTPVEDLNIHFPSIQLPSGISSLFGELAAHHQQSLSSSSGSGGSSSTTATTTTTTTTAATSSSSLTSTTSSSSADAAAAAAIEGAVHTSGGSVVQQQHSGGSVHQKKFEDHHPTKHHQQNGSAAAVPMQPLSFYQQQQQYSGSRASSSPATLSSCSGGGVSRATSVSCVIPMVPDGGVGAVNAEDGQQHHQPNGNVVRSLPTSAAATASVVAMNGFTAQQQQQQLDDVVGTGTPQQRRRRHSNAMRTSQSADRVPRTTRRASRPRTPRQTRSEASADAQAAQQQSNNINTTNSNNENRANINASSDSSGSSTAESGDETANINNLRRHLRNLFRMRHLILRQIVQQSAEFPSLYAIGSILCAVLILVVVLAQFFINQLIATLALLFSVSHCSDMISFKRLMSGAQASGWLIAAKVLLRQFMIGTVLGQTQWALPSLVFLQQHQQFWLPLMTSSSSSSPPLTVPEGVDNNNNGTFADALLLSSTQSPALSSSLPPPPTFWSTLYITILAQFLVMDLLLLFKLGIASFPSSWLGNSTKRRIFQWTEYSCAIYRFALPFVPWNAYFGAMWWTVLYGGIKLLFGFALFWAWLLSTLRFFRSAHIGTLPSEAECGQSEQCTICFSDFRVPIKLKCSHIFCTECIRTWLDREVTCPICRAVVTRQDNHYRNGDSMLPCVF
uniref:RING-type domain-containing protein n=1 Tax=Globodera rostochiensis TaxID=31243 RepID=A0A914HWI5_GLORO